LWRWGRGTPRPTTRALRELRHSLEVMASVALCPCLAILTAAHVLDMFSKHRYGPAMPDTAHLRPATPDEIADALSFALRYQGRKRVHHADDMMARITAERIVQHLEASGFVLMKGRPASAPTTANMPPAVE
jgi:hypothetical protein